MNHSTTSQPRLKLHLKTSDKWMEGLSLAGLLFIWLFVIFAYSSLPENIPMQFHSNGQADRMGKKESILLLPVIATGLYILLTTVNRSPHRFNYLQKITPENAERQYSMATRMIRYIKCAILILFGLIVWQIHSIANGNKGNMAPWLFVFSIGMVILPLAYYLIKSLRTK